MGVVAEVFFAGEASAPILLRNVDFYLQWVGSALLHPIGHHRRECDDESNHDDLDDHERHGAPVDFPGRHRIDDSSSDPVNVIAGGGHAAKIEERKAEGRMHEGSLQVDSQQNTEPDEVYAELVGNRREQRDDDERQLEKIEEEGEQKDNDVDRDQEAGLPPGKAREQALDLQIAVYASESGAEHRRADQDENHEGG